MELTELRNVLEKVQVIFAEASDGPAGVLGALESVLTLLFLFYLYFTERRLVAATPRRPRGGEARAPAPAAVQPVWR